MAEETKEPISETGFKVLHSTEIKQVINERIEELEFLYTDVDTLMHLAREFNWNEDRMQ